MDSDVACVAFSLNSLTNDCEELLINASRGLGEALVTGDITPDTVVVDKLNDAIITYRVGVKGGDRSEFKCLANDQIAEIAATVQRIETVYDEPIDFEWSISNGTVQVLQARPITTYIPLPESLQTEPGAPRHLYIDGYLTDGITMSTATTPMFDDTLDRILRTMTEWAMGIPARDINLAAVGINSGTPRMYVNLSMYMHLMGKGKAMAKLAKDMNPMMAGIFTSPQIERYRPAKPPAHDCLAPLSTWYVLADSTSDLRAL